MDACRSSTAAAQLAAMWLIRTSDGKLVGFQSDREVPPYAILSHRWLEDEVSFADMQQAQSSGKLQARRFDKIVSFCHRASRDGYEWVWVDTCCIDKSSSAELTEAINSMFRWYQNASICYVYMVDVHSLSDMHDPSSDFSTSLWFSRGWTLQELIAPTHMVFYSKDWAVMGTKRDLHHWLSQITGISSSYLLGESLETASAATKMSWAAHRKTTRIEDMAYCLLGLFDVNMPMLYGEGKKAFRRLQEEILRSSNDHTLFAWGTMVDLMGENRLGRSVEARLNAGQDLFHPDILAESPSQFAAVGNIKPFIHFTPFSTPPTFFSKGIRITMPGLDIGPTGALSWSNADVARLEWPKNISLVFPGYYGRYNDTSVQVVGLVIRNWSSGFFERQWMPIKLRCNSHDLFTGLTPANLKTVYLQPPHQLTFWRDGDISLTKTPTMGSGYALGNVYSFKPAHWDKVGRFIILNKMNSGPIATFVLNGSSRQSFALTIGLESSLKLGHSADLVTGGFDVRNIWAITTPLEAKGPAAVTHEEEQKVVNNLLKASREDNLPWDRQCNFVEGEGGEGSVHREFSLGSLSVVFRAAQKRMRWGGKLVTAVEVTAR